MNNVNLPSNVTVNGTTLNNGALTVSNSVVTWNGTFTNNGAYVSDPSTQTFVGDLDIGATGYLKGGAGDTFQVEGDFNNSSAQNTSWNTAGAKLQFSTLGTTGTAHTMTLAGLDLGATLSGYTDNFAWGVLSLDAGNTLALEGASGHALYLQSLSGLDFGSDPLDITNIFGDGFNIYYNTNADPALGDQIYMLADGGELIPVGEVTPVPEPSTWAMMGLGFAGLGFVGWRRRAAARAA